MAEAKKTADKVELTYEKDKSLDLPVLDVTEGNKGYDIGSLLKDTGNVSFDPGFVDTATPHLARRNTLTLTVTEGVLYLDLNGTSLMTSLHEHTLP